MLTVLAFFFPVPSSELRSGVTGVVIVVGVGISSFRRAASSESAQKVLLSNEMAPKESAAAKKAREKQEQFAAMQFQERQEYELEEERARSSSELMERAGRAELMLHFYEIMINPASRLMVSHATLDRLRHAMQSEGALSAQRLLEMQVELRRLEKGGEALQHEIVHLRGEVRGLLNQAAQSLGSIRSGVDKAVDGFITELEHSCRIHGDPVLATKLKAAELDVVLEDVRQRHVEVARKAQAKATDITRLWQEQTSMHTRIPPRIRRILQGLDKDDLLLIIDTLSFEDVVHKYLLYRYSPGIDDPMSYSTDEAAALMSPPCPPLS